MLNILSIFSKQVYYPNNLADGIKSGVIYHGVSRNFMTCLASFTKPILGITLERNSRIIETNRYKYLDYSEGHTVPVSKLDDFILLSQSMKSYWIFTISSEESTGSLGNILKSTITLNEFCSSIENNIKKIKKSPRKGSLTGEYMIIPSENKSFIFHK